MVEGERFHTLTMMTQAIISVENTRLGVQKLGSVPGPATTMTLSKSGPQSCHLEGERA